MGVESFLLYGYDSIASTSTAFSTIFPDQDTAPFVVGQTFTTGPTMSRAILELNDTDLFPRETSLNDISSSQNLTQPLELDGNTFGVGTNVEVNYGYTIRDTTTGEEATIYVLGFNDGSGEQQIGFATNKLLDSNATYEITGRFSTGDPPYSSLAICFAAGTMLRTKGGETDVVEIVPGDLVWTKDGGYQPVKWVGRRDLTSADLARAVNLCPILIRAGALGPCLPSADLIVSPQHRVLARSKITERMFGEREVLVAAKQLLTIDGIEQLRPDQGGVNYVHLMFDRHEIVLSNGAETESFYAGPQALRSVSPESLAEILTLFPELAERPDVLPTPARTMATGRKGRQFARRSQKNHVAVVALAS